MVIKKKITKPIKKKKKKKKKDPFKKKVTKSVSPNKEIISESLATLLIEQGHTKSGIEMYEKLGLNIPEKSSYFAGLISKIKKKQ